MQTSQDSDCNCLTQNWRVLEKLELELNQFICKQNIMRSPHLVLLTLGQGWFLVGDLFTKIKSVQDKKEFTHSLLHIDSLEFQATPEHQIKIRLSEDFKIEPFLLKSNQLSLEEIRLIVVTSPFIKKVSFDWTHIFQLKFSEVPPSKACQPEFEVEALSSVAKKAFLLWLANTHPGELKVLDKRTGFNLLAQPFQPKSEPKAEQEKKKSMSEMYAYYNYLLLNENRANLQHLDPQLRKIRYQMDSSANEDPQLTLDTTTEVVKAAIGRQNLSTFDKSQDLFPPKFNHQSIIHRYSNSQLISIFKQLGGFVHPKENLAELEVDEKNLEIIRVINEVTSERSNVLLENLKGIEFELGDPQSVLLDEMRSEIENAMNYRV